MTRFTPQRKALLAATALMVLPMTAAAAQLPNPNKSVAALDTTAQLAAAPIEQGIIQARGSDDHLMQSASDQRAIAAAAEGFIMPAAFIAGLGLPSATRGALAA